jgi:hypothetical protein
VPISQKHATLKDAALPAIVIWATSVLCYALIVILFLNVIIMQVPITNGIIAFLWFLMESSPMMSGMVFVTFLAYKLKEKQDDRMLIMYVGTSLIPSLWFIFWMEIYFWRIPFGIVQVVLMTIIFLGFCFIFRFFFEKYVPPGEKFKNWDNMDVLD